MVFGILVSVPAFSDPNAPIVQNEFAKQKEQMETQLFKAKKALQTAEDAWQTALNESKTEAQKDLEGLKTFKRYYSLLLNRYSSDNAQFQPWMPIQSKDVETINSLFETYLRSKPLKGRVSAGQADKTLDWGMSRLEEIHKIHDNPKTENNSELEIIHHQIKEAEASIDAIHSQASRLDIKLVEKDPREVAGNEETSGN